MIIVLYLTTRLSGDSDFDLWKMFMEGKSFVQYTEKMVHVEKSYFEYTMPFNPAFAACMKTTFLTYKRDYLLNTFL